MNISATSIAVLLSMHAASLGAATLPVGSAPPAITAPHFPSRLHAFVWRNWQCTNLDRMASVVDATPDQIAVIGASMGLPPHRPIGDDELSRNYISVIRRNWHLLDYDQLLMLLGWDTDRLAYALKEDDFLWHKLGRLKPACKPLKYEEPDAATLARCDEIKSLVLKLAGDEFNKPAQPRFDFVQELSRPADLPASQKPSATDAPIRFLYSYFAVYGDPLLDEKLNPYPDGLLERLQQVGVNGVWLHVVLRQLAPAQQFPEFGQGSQQRLANLRKLVDRASRYGIKIYLYMNEPRAMPEAFFVGRENMKGVGEAANFAMCTSDPQVRAWITDALRHVFHEVPGLGGVFTITGSENLTHCWSHHHGETCPRCSKRSPAEVVAELNAAIAAGVRDGSNGKAKTIVWDWGWPNPWCQAIINALPKDVYLMSVSEWDLPITRGGVSTAVGEYSMSAVGPGPRATNNWRLAHKAGLKTVAKVQVNCTWELSTVPYLPVMNLVAQHCERLANAGVEDMMLSWTLGGYPSPNLQLANMFSRRPTPTADDALHELAVTRYGPKAAPSALAAWTAFSNAFSEFPYHGSALYNGPLQLGPANLLYLTPTGYAATMVGFPYDDLNAWRAVYPANVFSQQLHKVADGWREGLQIWDDVIKNADTAPATKHAQIDKLRATTAYCHFESAANQVDFILARNALAAAHDSAARRTLVQKMNSLIDKETRLAIQLFAIARQDSTIGYEASNHYFYYPLDLLEKAINCEYIRKQLNQQGQNR